MNTIWLKIAGVAVVLVIALVVGSKYMSGDDPSGPSQSTSSEAEQPKTVYDMAERDKQFGEAPKPAEPTEAQPQPDQATAQATQPAEPAPKQPAPAPTPAPSGIVLPSNLTQTTTLYFKPLGEIADLEAQRILPMATAGRSIGRLPMTHFKLMVDGCRQILEKWPESKYAFRAKQMLEEMPERFWRNYKVTEEELDISMFLKQRPGTQPFTVEPIR